MVVWEVCLVDAHDPSAESVGLGDADEDAEGGEDGVDELGGLVGQELDERDEDAAENKHEGAQYDDDAVGGRASP